MNPTVGRESRVISNRVSHVSSKGDVREGCARGGRRQLTPASSMGKKGRAAAAARARQNASDASPFGLKAIVVALLFVCLAAAGPLAWQLFAADPFFASDNPPLSNLSKPDDGAPPAADASWDGALRCCDVPRHNATEMADASALHAVYAEDSPAIVHGLWSGRPCARWRLTELAERFGHTEMIFGATKAKGSHAEGHAELSRPFGHFIAAAQQSSHERHVYLLHEQLLYSLPRLAEELGAPPMQLGDDWFAYFPPEMRPEGRALNIGGPGSISSLHADPFNWTGTNTVFEGRKAWRFLPPSTPAEWLCARRKEINQNVTSSWTSKLDLFEMRDDSGGFKPGPISLGRCVVARKRLDELRRAMVEFVQEPGETVLIPPGWWHQVYHLEPTLGVAGQYLNEHNADVVFRNMLSYTGADEAAALPREGESAAERVRRVLSAVEAVQRDRLSSNVIPLELVKGSSKDGSEVEVSSSPLSLRISTSSSQGIVGLSRSIDVVPQLGWNNTPFVRHAPSATRANPLPAAFDGRHGEQCPSRSPGAAFPWTPKDARTLVAQLRNSYVVVDGGVVTPHKRSGDRHGTVHGDWYDWASPERPSMLLSAGLASLSTEIGEMTLHVPRGLGSLRRADAVRATRSQAPQSLVDAGARWQMWHEYPQKLGDGVDACAARPQPIARLYGRLAALNRFRSASYYHWTINTLPFAALVAEHEASLPLSASRRRMRYLVYRTSFAAQYLAILGIAADDIVYADPCLVYFGQEVYAPLGTGGGSLHLSQRHYAAVRNAVLPLLGIGGVTTVTDKRACAPVLLALRGAGESTQQRRGFLSSDTVEAMAAALRDALPLPADTSVSRLELGSRPVAEQVALFDGASLLVAVDGSALANAVFMRQGAAAISLTPTRGSRTGCGETRYWHLSSAVGVRFWSFLLPQHAWSDETLTLPLDEWREFVADVGEQLRCAG